MRQADLKHPHAHVHNEHPHARQSTEHLQGANSDSSHGSYSARKHPEFVALDIGADRGALIVHTAPGLHGVEVEISPTGHDRRRSHKEVLERSINGHPAFSAVFDGLRAGTYTLWVDDEARARGVKVEGGHVGQLDWRHAHVRT